MARSEEEEDRVEFRILDFGGGYWKDTSVGWSVGTQEALI